MRLLILAAVMAVAVSTAPVANAAKILRYVPAADLTGLDPQINGAMTTAEYSLMVYDTLFSLDANVTPRPQMVDHYTASADGLRYDFTLRPGLKFHDGRPVSSADVVPSINRWMKRDPLGQKMAAAISGFQVEGADSFSINFRQPFPFVETTLAWSGIGMAAILRKQDAETDPFKQITTSIGSGPFRFLPQRWQIGNGAAWERNPDYVPRAEPPSGFAGGKRVLVEGVEMHYIPDPSTRVNALKAGEVDLVDLLPADLIDYARADKNLVVGNLQPLGGLGFLRMNQLQPPFNNLKARQALALVVNQPEEMAAAYGEHGTWQPCHSFFLCGSPNGSEEGSAAYQHPDPAKARALLAESGYRGELIVIVTASDVPSQNAMAQVTAAALRAIGANVDVQVTEFAQIMVRREVRKPATEGGWNLIAIGASGPPLTSPITNLMISSRCDSETYFGWPCDASVEKLRADYMSEPNADARRRIVDDLSRALWGSLPAVIAGMYYNTYAWRAEVTGLVQAPQLVFWGLDKGN